MNLSPIRNLLATIEGANLAYRAGVPVMTDAAYNTLVDGLEDMVVGADPTDPDVLAARAWLATVGAVPDADSKWVKVRHAAPMTSLNKAVTPQELADWHASCGKRTGLVVSVKCDGASVSLKYSNGVLVQALTRGDGDVGEDITRNVKRMKGIVHTINGFTGHLRGEIVLLHSDWKKHFPTKANPRNAAVGTAKREDGVGSEHLTVLHYQMLRDGGTPITRKSIEFRALEKVGCAVARWELVADFAGVVAIYDRFVKTDRATTDFDIDGLVVEFDDLSVMETLGDLNKRPRGAVAAKFPPDAKETTLRDIRWQVGKSGRVTPVAEFDAVSLAGANVSNATLHNLSNIRTLCKPLGVPHLRVGDVLIASRRGDVIPGIESLLKSNGGLALAPPDECPACKTNLVMDGEYLVCRGEDCPAQVVGGISRWVRKIGVLGIGDSIIEALVEQAGVEDAADLYMLDPVKCESVTTSSGSRLGRTAHTLVAELKAKSEVPLHTFVGSLGIPLCARSMCKVIVDAGYDDLDKMAAASVTQLSVIPGMGSGKAEEFVKGFRARRTLMDKLLDCGVTIKAKAVGAMSGLSVCFTGVRLPDMEAEIEAQGGNVKGSVGKGLTFLVAKDPTGVSGKLDKARAMGVKVVGVDEMWGLLGKATGAPVGAFVPAPGAPAPSVRKVAPVTPPAAPKAPPASVLDLFGADE